MRLFLLSIGVFTTSESYLLAAEAGMPQLDPTYWASQAFWLILIFTTLYLTLSNLFIPKIKDSIDSRENKIKDDLDEAQKLKNLADKKLKEYEQSIESAKKEVQKIIFESKNELNSQIQSKKKEFEKEIENEIKAAEQEIDSFKKDSIENISTISEEMASKVIEQISGEPMNQSTHKAAILDMSNTNLGKHI
jgi:F-type H+-transporting ATPase subunit b